jgi:hypothetical protein
MENAYWEQGDDDEQQLWSMTTQATRSEDTHEIFLTLEP